MLVFTLILFFVSVSIKSLVLRWPGHMELINELKTSCYSTNINHGVMRRLFPKFRMKGITSFLRHYKRYDFLSITHKGDPVSLNEEQALAVKTTVTEIEKRMCAMMGVPIPRAGELIMENKRLSMIGDGLYLFTLASYLFTDASYQSLYLKLSYFFFS